MKITALIYAPAIEPSLKFWVDQLGFTKTVEVPDGDKLGFVILVKGDAELMIQSTASMEKDNSEMAKLARPAGVPLHPGERFRRPPEAPGVGTRGRAGGDHVLRDEGNRRA